MATQATPSAIGRVQPVAAVSTDLSNSIDFFIETRRLPKCSVLRSEE